MCGAQLPRTDAGLAFDMDTELNVDGERALARNLRVPVALAGAGGTHRRPAAAAAEGAEGRAVLAEFDVTLRDRVGLCARVQRLQPDPPERPCRALLRPARRDLPRHVVAGAQPRAGAVAGHPAPGTRLETQFLTPVQLPARSPSRNGRRTARRDAPCATCARAASTCTRWTSARTQGRRKPRPDQGCSLRRWTVTPA